MKDTQVRWDLEGIRKAIEKFRTEFGKNPTTRDFDRCIYLPSSKQMQRRFGGIEKMRAGLNLEGPLNYTKGEYRSQRAKKIKQDSYKIEAELYDYLINIYSEIHVHEQKRLRPGNVASDFFVYLNHNTGYAIDVFQAEDLFALRAVANIKVKRYEGLKDFNIYFVAVGNYSQNEVNRMMENKKNLWPGNIMVLTLENFKENIALIK